MSTIDQKENTDDDEISLLEIYQILRQSWKWILAFVILGGAGGFLVLLLPAKYEVSAYLEQPLAPQYMAVNEGRTSLSGLKWVSGGDLYQYFLDRLISDAAKQEFFEKTYLPSLSKQPADEKERNALYTGMSKKQIIINEPKPNKGRQLYSVQVQAPTGALSVRWAQDFLEQVEAAARERWLSDETKAITTTIRNIEKDLSEKYILARKLREDREIRLEEALKVASVIGQQNPRLTVGQLPRQDSVTAFADGSSLYARGAKSLGAEIDVLRSRKDETSFIDGLREAQARLKALQEQKLDEQAIGMYRIDGQLLEPASPVFPKKTLMIALGLLLGFFFGVVFSFIKNAVESRRSAAASS